MDNYKPKTPAQRLAAVVNKCFSTQSAATKDEMRYAVYSKFVGRPIKGSEDLNANEIQLMLTQLEDYQAPFNPSELGKKKICAMIAEYQNEQGQIEMKL